MNRLRVKKPVTFILFLGGKQYVIKKVYQVSKKGKEETPRLFLQHLVCEAAGFIRGIN